MLIIKQNTNFKENSFIPSQEEEESWFKQNKKYVKFLSNFFFILS
jgi:hypothetical protein